MRAFERKVALVTGGSRGIGKAIVTALSDAGALVAFTYKSSGQAAEEFAADLRGRGRKATAYQSDAASPSDAARVVDAVIKEWGRLDILVNNAGITKDGLLMRM